MERFSYLLWANEMSCHFSLFLNFILLYIFLIYGVFFKNEILHDFKLKTIIAYYMLIDELE